jgi:hypothetical protein
LRHHLTRVTRKHGQRRRAVAHYEDLRFAVAVNITGHAACGPTLHCGLPNLAAGAAFQRTHAPLKGHYDVDCASTSGNYDRRDGLCAAVSSRLSALGARAKARSPESNAVRTVKSIDHAFFINTNKV